MSKYCPYCGEEQIDAAKFCKNCGKNIENPKYNPQNSNPNQFEKIEKEYKISIILGYIFAVLIPLIGLIISVYLLTRKDSSKATKHGKYTLIVAVGVWIISFLFF